MTASPTVWIVALGALVGAALLIFYQREDADSADRAPAIQAAAPETERGPKLDEAIARAAPDVSIQKNPRQQAQPPENSPDDTPASTTRVFLEIRGVPLVPPIQSEQSEFAAEPRDPAWATGMEARFQSELAQSRLTFTESHVECRRSRCIVLLVRPPGTYAQTQQVGLPNRAFVVEFSSVAQTLDLLGARSFGVMTRDGAVVHWQRFHRRCGPDWRCLE